MAKKRKTSIQIEIPKREKEFQRIKISDYVCRPDQTDKMLQAYDQVKDAPKILLDLSEADWIQSIGVAAITKIVNMSRESQFNQKVYVIVPQEFKEEYFDEYPWAHGRVFDKEKDIPLNL
jgi:hypothetical protein